MNWKGSLECPERHAHPQPLGAVGHRCPDHVGRFVVGRRDGLVEVHRLVDEGHGVADDVLGDDLLRAGSRGGGEESNGDEDGNEPCGETRHARTLGCPSPVM